MFSWVSFYSTPDFADVAANWTPDGNNPRTRNKGLSTVVKREKGGRDIKQLQQKPKKTRKNSLSHRITYENNQGNVFQRSSQYNFHHSKNSVSTSSLCSSILIHSLSYFRDADILLELLRCFLPGLDYSTAVFFVLLSSFIFSRFLLNRLFFCHAALQKKSRYTRAYQ